MTTCRRKDHDLAVVSESPGHRLETYRAVFQWVLQVLAEKRLLKGTAIGVDATTLEANAALRSIVRR
jgi:hypothetical protein